MESLTQQMNVMFPRFEAGQHGQIQRPPTLAPMQTSAHGNLYFLLVVEQTVNINHSSVTSAEDQDT